MYVMVWKTFVTDGKPFWCGEATWSEDLGQATRLDKKPGWFDGKYNLFVTVEEAQDLVTLAAL